MAAHGVNVFAGFVGIGFGQIDFDIFALADIINAVKTERAQRVSDGFTLWIENAVFQRYMYFCFQLYPQLKRLLLHQMRPLKITIVPFGQDAETAGDFLVGLCDFIQIITKAIFVHFFVGF